MNRRIFTRNIPGLWRGGGVPSAHLQHPSSHTKPHPVPPAADQTRAAHHQIRPDMTGGGRAFVCGGVGVDTGLWLDPPSPKKGSIDAPPPKS